MYTDFGLRENADSTATLEVCFVSEERSKYGSDHQFDFPGRIDTLRRME